MSTSITSDVIRHLAELAQLQLSAAAEAKFTTQVDSIFAHIQRIQELNLDQVDEKLVSEQHNVWREDIVQPSLTRESVLANAPHAWNGYVVVPGIFTEES